ncbi:Eco57I restriction-modification methylase domain-containing protein [Formosa maritima]|uniref:site-specific DNA-methyltransferase (adenine-specific) n=1 Tax=Formosa maritima TaxID=2592046 RepID=A0A5D0G9I7_9FLAO|nr:TaqI-like C-terminal specificity domain-containing protein [Formosa maritima]TYA55290.1 N-6 DNA methylase [Formosa maritima]
MALFQASVLTQHFKLQNQTKVDEAYNTFTAYFHNTEIQENIRNSKEEQYQGEFLIDLFVNVLGYIKNPTPDFNLTTEYKNVKDSKKADGAIIIQDEVRAVIELKGTNTTDLGKIEAQAFGYKNNQPKCSYVITSNFEKLRFYIDNAIEHVEFNLFTLSKKEFDILYLCLAFENIQKDLPAKIKKDSVSEEDVITKSLYKDYSLFKRDLHKNLVSLNPQFDSLTLFKESQTLLDRFLFLFFAEDRQLLPPNSVRLVLSQWKKLQDLDAYTPLFDRFKKYFGYLNTGFKGKNYDVYAYNGGLFKPNAVLDSVVIDDELLYKHTLKLSEYDFDSEVDVNILGHIFENSLNEIDEVKAQLEGQEVDKTKSKRKKDGVFYTPKYITKYIVEHTVGKLCEDKKLELGILEADYITDKKRQKKTIKGLVDTLTTYRNWLLQLTICDPACGSGAFLNQALDFLIAEHGYIDELQAKLFGDAMVLSDVEKSILENNLFGVDLNEESVEIAKLSLWLRTAVPNRKLNDLSNNIKCGNSLIDNPEIAGDKAFNWQKEFPHIFEKGGFDVIIGNPPYVLCQPSNTLSTVLDYYKGYKVASYKIDLFHLFFEKSIKILRNNGKLGFITPNTYLNNKYIKPLREFILNNTYINSLVNYRDQIFIDAGVDVATIVLTKSNIINEKIEAFEVENTETKFLGFKQQSVWNDDSENTFNLNPIFEINYQNSVALEEICSVTFGLQTKDKSIYVAEYKKDIDWESCYTGKDIGRYILAESSLFFKNKIDEVKAGGSWNMEIHHSKKIVVRQVGNPEPIFAFDDFGFATLNTMYSIVKNSNDFEYYYLISILNSKLMKKIFLSKYSDGKQLFPKVKGFQLKTLPIKNIPLSAQQPFIEQADLMLSLNKDLQEVSGKFQRALQREFETLDKLPKKLEAWYQLSYTDFIKELKKKKVELSLQKKAEWEDYFLAEQAKAVALQSQIQQTDRAIDQMVYALYGLTDAEIAIVEAS